MNAPRTIAALLAAVMAFGAFTGGAAAHTSDEHGEITFYDGPDAEGQQAPTEDGEAPDDFVDLECEFWIEGTDISHPEGSIDVWRITGPGTSFETTLATWNFTPEENATYEFDKGPLTLNESWDHYFIIADMEDEDHHTTEGHHVDYTACEDDEEQEPETPVCPANVETTAHEDETVDLSWDASAGADSYNVYRATAGESFEHVAEVESTSFTDTETEADVTYQYRVTAANEAGESAECPVAEVTAIPVFGTPAIAALAAVGGVGAMTALRRRG